MKKLLAILMILFVGILVCGCTSTTPTTPATTPTAAPTTEMPTSVPTNVAPTPVPTNATVNVTKTPTPAPTAEPVWTMTFTQTGTLIPDPKITVPVGTRIVFVSDDPYKQHGVKSINAVDVGKFDSGTLLYKQSYSYTCVKAGTIEYTTTFQPYIVSTINCK
jgi:hypothetical protein